MPSTVSVLRSCQQDAGDQKVDHCTTETMTTTEAGSPSGKYCKKTII